MAYTTTILSDLPGTGSFWQFTEASGTLVDSGGGAHNSTDNTNLTYRQAGPNFSEPTNYALGFNGVDSSTGFGAAIFEFLGTASYSIEFWVKPTDLSNNPFVVQKQNGSEGWYMRVLAAGGVRMARLQAAATDQLDTASGLVSTGSYSHIVGTYDGTNMQVYVNGVSAAGPTASAKSIQTNAVSVSFGGLFGAGNKTTGTMALPALYPGVALSSTQVAAHYASVQGAGAPARPVMMWP